MDLENNFVKWDQEHHTDFKLLSGGTEPGDRIYFEEIVSGVKYSIKGKIIEKSKSDDRFVLAFKTFAGLSHIYFIGETSGEAVRFTHIEQFGLKAPILGSLVNFLLFKVLARKKANWDLILGDMKDDNVRLKNIMEVSATSS